MGPNIDRECCCSLVSNIDVVCCVIAVSTAPCLVVQPESIRHSDQFGQQWQITNSSIGAVYVCAGEPHLTLGQ